MQRMTGAGSRLLVFLTYSSLILTQTPFSAYALRPAGIEESEKPKKEIVTALRSGVEERGSSSKFASLKLETLEGRILPSSTPIPAPIDPSRAALVASPTTPDSSAADSQGSKDLSIWRTTQINRLYQTYLQRKADPDGLQSHLQLSQAGVPLAKIEAAFLNNPEYQKVFVSTLYHVYLGREGSDKEIEGWLKALGAGSTRRQVQLSFLDYADPEFDQLARSPERQEARRTFQKEFVDNLYRSLFERDADAQGFQNWLDALNRGVLPERIIQEFRQAPETSIHDVHELYRIFLRREGDPQGVDGWVKRLGAGATIEQVAATFVASEEYRNGNFPDHNDPSSIPGVPGAPEVPGNRPRPVNFTISLSGSTYVFTYVLDNGISIRQEFDPAAHTIKTNPGTGDIVTTSNSVGSYTASLQTIKNAAAQSLSSASGETTRLLQELISAADADLRQFIVINLPGSLLPGYPYRGSRIGPIYNISELKQNPLTITEYTLNIEKGTLQRFNPRGNPKTVTFVRSLDPSGYRAAVAEMLDASKRFLQALGSTPDLPPGPTTEDFPTVAVQMEGLRKIIDDLTALLGSFDGQTDTFFKTSSVSGSNPFYSVSHSSKNPYSDLYEVTRVTEVNGVPTTKSFSLNIFVRILVITTQTPSQPPKIQTFFHLSLPVTYRSNLDVMEQTADLFFKALAAGPDPHQLDPTQPTKAVQMARVQSVIDAVHTERLRAAGVEENTLSAMDQAIAAVSEAAHVRGNTGLVVMDASVIRETAGLEEFLKRLPADEVGGRFIIVGASPPAERIAVRNPNVRFAVGLEATVEMVLKYPSNNVHVLGGDSFFGSLRDKLRSFPIEVLPVDLRLGLKGLLAALGVPQEVLRAVNWDAAQAILAGIEEMV